MISAGIDQIVIDIDIVETVDGDQGEILHIRHIARQELQGDIQELLRVDLKFLHMFTFIVIAQEFLIASLNER